MEYAREVIDNGADVIAIGDPTATGEILGPRIFEDFAVRYLNQVCDAVHANGKQVIVHICGDMSEKPQPTRRRSMPTPSASTPWSI